MRVEDGCDDLLLAGVRLDGLDARRGLKRIGRVNDENPVAVAEERHGLGYLRLPGG